MKAILLLLSLLGTLINANAANRFWVGTGANQNWSNMANWSLASGGAGGATVPGVNDRAIFDANGNINCNIDIAVNIRGLFVQAGYTSTINQNNNALTCGNQDIIFDAGTFNGGGGAITVNGIFTMGGGIFNCNNSSLTESGAFTITAGSFSGNTATLDFNNNLNLNGGTFNSSSTTLNLTGNLSKPTAGAFQHNNGTIIFDGSSNSTINVNGASGGRIQFYNMELNKNAANDNLTTNGSDTVTVTNDLLVTDGQLAGSSVLQIQGDISCLANMSGATVQLEFTGSSNQQFTMNAAVVGNWNGNVVINQSTASQVILNSDLVLDAGTGQVLSFVLGIIVSTSTNLLTIGDNSAVSGTSNNSYVDGQVEKTGNDHFIFPLGNGGYYGGIALTGGTSFTSNLSSATSFTATYLRTNPHPTYDTSMRDVTLSNISGCEYWNLTRNSGTANAYLWLSYDDTRSCSVTDSTTLRVSRWNGSSWNDLGNGSFATVPFIRSQNIATAFGVITLGSTDAFSNPLPVRWIDFSAKWVNGKAELRWITASEKDNASFEIERSGDGINFSQIGKQPGSGTTSGLSQYLFTDQAPLKQLNYYRIRQVDQDGNASYSKIITLNGARQITVSQLKIYPNPSSSFRVTLLTDFIDKKLTLLAFDINGKLVLSTVARTNNSGQATLNLENRIAQAGYYSIVVTDGTRSVKQLLLIK